MLKPVKQRMIMQSLERHALYNLIRMNWLNDPNLAVEPWQVEDYRALSSQDLFEKLKKFSLDLNRVSFIAYAEECDSPEELTDHLIGDEPIETEIGDQIYLLVFELWRRLMTEKPSLSILCNELDHQIFIHDRHPQEQSPDLQDALGNFALLLNENVDEGIAADEAFNLITPYFANDIENFLYDYIYEQINIENLSYAQDLLDNFAPYLKGNKWFELLYIRLIENSNNKLAKKMLVHLMEDYIDEKDLDFNLELLAFLLSTGHHNDFNALASETTSLLVTEEDFQDFLSLYADFCHHEGEVNQEERIQSLLQKRAAIHPETPIRPNDPDLTEIESFVQNWKED